MTFTKLGGNDALFTLKAFLSAIMAYYIALRISLWATQRGADHARRGIVSAV